MAHARVRRTNRRSGRRRPAARTRIGGIGSNDVVAIAPSQSVGLFGDSELAGEVLAEARRVATEQGAQLLVDRLAADCD